MLVNISGKIAMIDLGTGGFYFYNKITDDFNQLFISALEFDKWHIGFTRYWDNRKQEYTDGRESGSCKFKKQQVTGGGWLEIAPHCESGAKFSISLGEYDARYYASANNEQLKEIHDVISNILRGQNNAE